MPFSMSSNQISPEETLPGSLTTSVPEAVSLVPSWLGLARDPRARLKSEGMGEPAEACRLAKVKMTAPEAEKARRTSAKTVAAYRVRKARRQVKSSTPLGSEGEGECDGVGGDGCHQENRPCHFPTLLLLVLGRSTIV